MVNRKQKKELRERKSTQQLMGIDQITDYGMKTAKGDLAFFLIKPDNLSVLSEEGVRGRVKALTGFVSGVESARLLALDSRESFQRNKDWYRRRMEHEDNPAIRELLRLDAEHLDEIQTSTASAREFIFVVPLEPQSDEVRHNYLAQCAGKIRTLGFRVRQAKEQDIKRILAVYYQHDVTTEIFDDFDGERWVNENG